MLRHLPNILSGLRLALAPAAAWFVVAENFVTAFGLFALAGITDALDGQLAKALNCPTKLGKILDPMADKALMTAAFVALAYIGDVPLWVAVLVIGRDVLMAAAIGVCLLLGVRVETAPLFIGKVTTAAQIIYLGVHMGALAFAVSLRGIVPVDAYLVAALTTVSTAPYFWRWLDALRTRRLA